MQEMDVRQQPRHYGAGSGVEPEKALGRLSFDEVPRPGEYLEVRDETWVVTEVDDDAVYVTPLGAADEPPPPLA